MAPGEAVCGLYLLRHEGVCWIYYPIILFRLYLYGKLALYI